MDMNVSLSAWARVCAPRSVCVCTRAPLHVSMQELLPRGRLYHQMAKLAENGIGHCAPIPEKNGLAHEFWRGALLPDCRVFERMSGHCAPST